MKQCIKCGANLSYGRILKSFWMGYKHFTCDRCGAEYAFTIQDRVLGGLVVGISTFTTGLSISHLDLTFTWKLVVGILMMISLSLILSVACLPFFSYECQDKKS